MDIQGAAAIVTGGGSGMGAATAAALAGAGAKVTVIDRDGDRAQATAETVGGRAVACDVADGAAMAEAVDDAAAADGPPRIAVACAGIAPAARVVGKDGPHDLDLFRTTIEVNLIGTFNLMRLAAAHMAAADPLPGEDGERGLIVMTASVAAFEGQIGQAAYSASKGGVAGLTLPAARELARHGVRVVTVAPGLIGTPMLMTMSDPVRESLIAATLFPHRLGKPEEFADLVLHIAGNPLINGETIRLDGAVRLAPK